MFVGAYYYPTGTSSQFTMPGGPSLPTFPGSEPYPGAPSSSFDIFGVDIGQAAEWWQISQEVLDVWGDITAAYAGDAPWGYDNRPMDVCPGTPNFDAVFRWTQKAPESEISKAVKYLRDANNGKGPKNRAQLATKESLPYWVKALMGGKGCVASTFPEAPTWFRASVHEYGAPDTPEDLIPGFSAIADVPVSPILAVGGALLAVLLLRRFF